MPRVLKKRLANIKFKVRVVAAQLPELFIPGEKKIQNLGDIEVDPLLGKGCLELVQKLTRYMQRMKSNFMSDDGRCVDYRALRESVLFDEYKKASRHLREADLSELTDSERKAFFLNVYNILTLHGMAAHSRIPASPLEVRGFWRRMCYDIGGLVYSLDDIEHGLLRGNKAHGGKVPFKKADDPRRVFCQDVDPRIHFALVCGAKSCPAIGVFTPGNVDRALDLAAENYVQQEITVRVVKRTIDLPRIFSWYGEDFGDTKEDVIDWCAQYMSKEQLSALEILDYISTEPIELNFTDYNWRLNALPSKQSFDVSSAASKARRKTLSDTTVHPSIDEDDDDIAPGKGKVHMRSFSDTALVKGASPMLRQPSIDTHHEFIEEDDHDDTP